MPIVLRHAKLKARRSKLAPVSSDSMSGIMGPLFTLKTKKIGPFTLCENQSFLLELSARGGPTLGWQIHKF